MGNCFKVVEAFELKPRLKLFQKTVSDAFPESFHLNLINESFEDSFDLFQKTRIQAFPESFH